MPPSLLLRRSTHRILAFTLRALEKTVSLLVGLEAKPFFDVAFTLLSGQGSSNDVVEVNSASVLRS
jgi:hypothetical protein